jgi:hypothetical protein
LPDGTPVERFISFIPNSDHKAESVEGAVLSTLGSLNTDLGDFRSQSYDNAANMSGTYNGLQTRIKQFNPLATFVPCAGHSLQLVGSVAAESSDESIAFFALEQQLCTIFFHLPLADEKFYYQNLKQTPLCLF